MNVCISADRLCDESTNAGCHNCPGHYLVVGVFGNCIHLAGEVCFVDFKTSAVDNRAISWNLVSSA